MQKIYCGWRFHSKTLYTGFFQCKEKNNKAKETWKSINKIDLKTIIVNFIKQLKKLMLTIIKHISQEYLKGLSPTTAILTLSDRL